MFAAWALSQPLMAAPDEPAHVVKAAAVARGELTGEPNPKLPHMPLTVVQVPEVFESSNKLPRCYLMQPEVDASCSPALSDDTADIDAGTYAGLYPPAYYAVVGLPTLAWQNAFAIYLMRLVGATLSAVLLTGAVVAARGARGGGLLFAGVFASLTPMTVFLSGMVNPSSVEIAAAVALWTALLAVTTWWRERIPTYLLAWVTASASALVLVRLSGSLWLAAIGIAVVVARGVAPLVRVVRKQPSAQVALAVVVLAVASAVGWFAYVGDVGLTGTPAEGSTRELAVESLSRTLTRIRESVGSFGWLDANPPLLTYVLWFGLAGALTVAALFLASRRTRLAIAFVAAVFVATPVVFETLEAREVGFYWQARYSMPVLAGIPILSAFVLTRRASPTRRTLEWGSAVVAVVFVVAHALALLQAMRRFMVGASGGLDFLVDSRWEPPVEPIALALAGVAATAALAWQLRRLALETAPSAPG